MKPGLRDLLNPVTPPSLAKLAQALRDYTPPEPSVGDLYAVKVAGITAAPASFAPTSDLSGLAASLRHRSAQDAHRRSKQAAVALEAAVTLEALKRLRAV